MKRKGPVRDAGKERFWQNNIGQQRRSGLSIREFCRQHGLTEPSFYAWRGELNRRRTARAEKSRTHAAKSNRVNADGDRTRFASVRLVPDNVAALNIATALQFAAIELVLPNGVLVRMPANAEPAIVAALLNAWEQGRC